MHFKKMHGLGNDFVIIDARTQSVTLGPEQTQAICDRHFGVGCDTLALIEPSEKADAFARFYNADGSESAACGNASRCIADIIMQETGKESCVIETGRGPLKCMRAGEGLISVDMGIPKFEWQDIPLSEEKDTLHLNFKEFQDSSATLVNMGNPHCVFFEDDVDAWPVTQIGPQIENYRFFPERTNVEFIQLISPTRIKQRTWERGCGETLACGSGACAAVVAAIRREVVRGRIIDVELKGGELRIEWRESDGHVIMTGPVEYVFDGYLRNI